MTCMYTVQPTTMNSMDFRALMPIDNTSGFQLTSGGGIRAGGGGGGGGAYDLGMFGRPHFDLDLVMDDEGFLDDYVSPSSYGVGLSSMDASSPLSRSSNMSNNSNSSNSSCGKDMDAGGGGEGCSSSGRSTKLGREDKICGVCGDKALGFNFDAISCESCKAFFRRNAPKGLGYFKCPYDEKCKMDTTNRRFCKRCRLKKCFQIGMKKEYILTDVEKATKRRKIEENRYLKKVTTINVDGAGGATTTATNNTTINTTNTNAASLIITQKMSPPSLVVESPPGFIPSCSWSTMETKWPMTTTTTPATLTTLTTSGPSAASASGWQMMMTTTPLTQEDAATINDLRVAYRNSLEVNVEKVVSPRHQANLTDLVNIAELSVRRVISMVKQVTSFRNLPQVEQIHLLKGGSIELLIIRSVITFDQEKQHFLDPVDHEETSAMRLDQLEKAENGLGLFEEHMKFIRSLAADLQADETTLILLLVISLFSPDRENLTWKNLVSQEQEKYSMLLKNYLESIHPPSIASRLFPKLLMKLTDVRNLNEEHSQVLLKVKPEGIHPLMKEVLDLTS